MAKMVTREFKKLDVTVKVYDSSKEQLVKECVELAYSPVKSNEDLIKRLKKVHPDKVIVDIESYEVSTTLYGMLESDFLRSAIELDPKTRKPLDTE